MWDGKEFSSDDKKCQDIQWAWVPNIQGNVVTYKFLQILI